MNHLSMNHPTMNDLPTLPQADIYRLNPIAPADLVLAFLAAQGRTTMSARGIGRALKPWGLSAGPALDGALAHLRDAGLAHRMAGGAWDLTQAGHGEARRLSVSGWAVKDWPRQAKNHFLAQALGLAESGPDIADYLSDRRAVYAATLDRLFDLGGGARPRLDTARAALIWRLLAARFPDMMPARPPSAKNTPTALKDDATRTIFLRFCGVERGRLDAGVSALLRTALGAPKARDTSALCQAVVRCALQINAAQDADVQPAIKESTASPTSEADFAETIREIARSIKTPKRRGGYFSGSQVAIAQLYDEYAERSGHGVTLDDFKSRLWGAVRSGAAFHLTRLDIPDLMDDELRRRSSTPTRSGDIVHFVVLD
jgi:hypothetical protein